MLQLSSFYIDRELLIISMGIGTFDYVVVCVFELATYVPKNRSLNCHWYFLSTLDLERRYQVIQHV